MSSGGEFPSAFGEGAADEFKDRLKDLMCAQRAAFEDVQAETGGRSQPIERIQLVEHAIVLAGAGLGTLGPRATPEKPPMPWSCCPLGDDRRAGLAPPLRIGNA